MRILYASFDEVPSYKGASTHILSSSRQLVREHELHLVTLGSVVLPALDGLRHHPQHLDEPNYLRRGLLFRQRVAAMAQKIAPDRVHFRSPWEGLPLLELGVPSLYEVNGLPSMELPHSYAGIPASVLATLRSWESRCLAAAHTVVCPSPRIRAHLLEREGDALSHKLHLVPNGYDLAPRVEAVPTAGPLRLSYLGTLHPWQGLFRILRALAALGDQCTLDLFVPPNRTWEPLLRKRLARLGLQERVRILPPLHRTRLAGVLPGYHLGIAPLLKVERNTTQGCDPIKILDYLSHGLPVIAPDLFVVRQAVQHEHNGLLYEPDQAHGFTDAVSRLHGDRALLARLRANSQPSLRARPDWNAHAARIAALHRQPSAAA